jgi:hypothetical protein
VSAALAFVGGVVVMTITVVVGARSGRGRKWVAFFTETVAGAFCLAAVLFAAAVFMCVVCATV